MKSKVLTYGLVVMVIALWGIIIFRVADAASGDEQFAVATKIPIFKRDTVAEVVQIADTARLILNYPDPFSDQIKTEQNQIPIDRLISKVPKKQVVAKSTINWGFINYSGFVKNARSKKMLAMITINSKTYMLLEGETADHVKLLRNMKDSIKVQYNGLQKFILTDLK